MRNTRPASSIAKPVLPALACGILAAGGMTQLATPGTTTSGNGNLPVANFVLPRAQETTEAPGVVFWAFSPFDSRRQLVIASRLINRLQNREMTGIRLRRNFSQDVLESGEIDLEIWLSHTQTSPWAMSRTFAGNRGPDHVKVFDGTVYLPASPPPLQSPAPWDRPYSVEITFDVPFPYKSGALCVETVTKNTSSSTPWWPIDGSVTSLKGAVSKFGTSCIPGLGDRAAGADPASMTVGSTAVFTLQGSHAPGGAVCMVGASNSVMNGTTLPLDLGPLLGATGCNLYTNATTLIPAVFSPMPSGLHGNATATMDIPLDPQLQGTVLYSQWMMSDPGVNPLGATFSNAVQTTIGASRLRNIGWLESMSLSATDGRLLTGRVPVLQLVSQ